MREDLSVALPEKEIGRGLVMRPLRAEDSDRIAEILRQDPDIKKVVTWTAHVNSSEDVPSAMAGFQVLGGLVQFGFERNGLLEVYVGIFPLTFTNQEGDYAFGYFCAPESRRQGLVREAMEATIEYTKENLHPQSLALYITDWNDASQRVADGLGFKKTDEFITDPILKCDERRWERVP